MRGEVVDIELRHHLRAAHQDSKHPGSAPSHVLNYLSRQHDIIGRMSFVQTFHLPHFSSYPIYISLFKDVENASFLRQQLLEANAEFEYAFLDATMVCVPLPDSAFISGSRARL